MTLKSQLAKKISNSQELKKLDLNWKDEETGKPLELYSSAITLGEVNKIQTWARGDDSQVPIYTAIEKVHDKNGSKVWDISDKKMLEGMGAVMAGELFEALNKAGGVDSIEAAEKP